MAELTRRIKKILEDNLRYVWVAGEISNFKTYPSGHLYFTLKDDQGNDWKSEDHYGKKIVVVYFYPADMTPGCTKQACGFRDDLGKLADKGVEVVGVSGDSVRNHQLFKKAHDLNFALLADTDGEVAEAFGVPVVKGEKEVKAKIDGKDELLVRSITAKRWTFVIGKDGKIAAKNTEVTPAEDSKAILDLVDQFEALDVDSIWVSDRLVSTGLILEPVVFLSYIAGRLRKMKLGTSTLVLPTRNPIVLAKELATLDFLSRGRLFPAVGLGGEESRDLQAVGVSKRERAGRTDEMIVLMRRLWTEESVTFKGKYFAVENATVKPRPWQKNGLPLWIGGRSEAALRRTGHLGDGWLVSSVSPEEVKAGIGSIRAYAAEAGRQVPEDHYGVLIPFYFAASADKALETASGSIRARADLPSAEFAALGTPEDARARVRAYIAAGASKFIMRPCGPFDSWPEQIETLAQEIIRPLQTPD